MFKQLIFRNIRFYSKHHILLSFSLALISLIFCSALLIDHSLKEQLKSIGKVKIGHYTHSIFTDKHLFSYELFVNFNKDYADSTCFLKYNSQLHIPGTTQKVTNIQAYGVKDSFFHYTDKNYTFPKETGIVLNQLCADDLGVKKGEDIIISLQKNSKIQLDNGLSNINDTQLTRRLKVIDIISKKQLGYFSLTGSQNHQRNAFIALNTLQDMTDNEDLLNGIMIKSIDAEQTIQQNFKKFLTLKDYHLKVSQHKDFIKVQSDDFFIDDQISQSIHNQFNSSHQQLSWFIESFQSNNGKNCYYSMLAANDFILKQFNIKLEDHEIAIHHWLAEDLNLRIGDILTINYDTLSTMRKKVRNSTQFKVTHILDSKKLDQLNYLSSFIPGMSDSDHCRDWESGFDIDFSKIRKKDEAFWEKYQSSPKAFISLKSGKAFWNNPFGNQTEIFIESSEGPDTISNTILKTLPNYSFSIIPIKTAFEHAANQSFDFTSLFIALSFFLFISVFIIAYLQFTVLIEERSEELKLFQTLGFNDKVIKKILRIEFIFIIFLSAIIGACLSPLSTNMILNLLTTSWSETTQLQSLPFSFSLSSILNGAIIHFLVCLSFFHFTLRKVLNKKEKSKPIKRTFSQYISITFFVIGFFLYITPYQNQTQAYLFSFLAGLSVLTACTFLLSFLLNYFSKRTISPFTRWTVIIRNINQLKTQHLLSSILLASGLFFSLTMQNFKLDFNDIKMQKEGFLPYHTFLTCHTPQYQSPKALNQDLLNKEEKLILQEAQFVPLYSSNGDDASCLNLIRKKTPPIYGIETKQLDPNFLKINNSLFNESSVKELLQKTLDSENTLPIIIDEASMMWNLKMFLGDYFEFKNHHGETFKLKIVGTTAPNLLQGKVLLSAENFKKYIQQDLSYDFFLVSSKEPYEQLKSILQKITFKNNIETQKSSSMLSAFNEVQNTYLIIFQSLGLLSILLGSIGFSLNIIRNFFNRSIDHDLLKSLGFSSIKKIKLTFYENTTVFTTALFIATVSVLIGNSKSSSQSLLNQLLTTLYPICIIGLFGLVFIALTSLILIKSKK